MFFLDFDLEPILGWIECDFGCEKITKFLKILRTSDKNPLLKSKNPVLKSNPKQTFKPRRPLRIFPFQLGPDLHGKGPAHR